MPAGKSLAIFPSVANTAQVDSQLDRPSSKKKIAYSIAAVMGAGVAIWFAFVLPRTDRATAPAAAVPPAQPPAEVPPPPPNAHRYAFAHHRLLHAGAFEGVASPTDPNWRVAPGLDVQVVAEGFTYPINIAFAQSPPQDDDAPWFYVSELHGTVKYVTRAGDVEVFARDLINFEPTEQVKTDETGISGLALIPNTGDLLITTSFEEEASGLLKNRIVRLFSEDGGKRMARSEVIVDLDEFTSPSNQIQQALVGQDDKLYVSVGDAENARLSLDLNKFGGKILRLNLDGSAPADNPFYDASAPKDPRSYVFAYGLRNVFDFDFDPIGGEWFAGDNGKDIDRFTRIERGRSYGWNGVRESVRLNSLYTWAPAIAPVGFTFLRNDTLGKDSRGTAVLASYGPPAALGAGLGKSLLRIQLDDSRKRLAAIPTPIVQYVGEGRATVLGVAEGPDGVYFTDFFGETKAASSEGEGRVWKVHPSEATRHLATGETTDLDGTDNVTKGRIYFFSFCASCHTLDGVGGNEGPNLTHFGQDAQGDLNSQAYDATLAQLIAREDGFFASQKPRLLAVQQSRGRDRVHHWLRHHLEEPRFDNARAKMPSMGFVAEPVRDAIIEFLMSRVPE